MPKKRLTKEETRFAADTALELGRLVTSEKQGNQVYRGLDVKGHQRSTMGRKLARLAEIAAKQAA